MSKNSKNKIRFNSLKFASIFVEKFFTFFFNSFNFWIKITTPQGVACQLFLFIREIFGDNFCSVADDYGTGAFFIIIGSAL